LALGLYTFPPTLDDAQLSRLSQLIDPDERIQIRRITFASPGSIDLIGLGAVIGHLKDFVLGLIERSDSKRRRELRDEREELENERLRLENVRTFVAFARDLGYSEIEIRQLGAYVDEKQESIIQLVKEDKLRGVSDLNRTEDR
jgi:hypothetical protein